jgi:predicted DCC family thiol-disulfide oxidoreductase YuxK
MNSPEIILFDGDCTLCCKMVQFIIKRNKQICCVSLQSAAGQSVLLNHGYPVKDISSVVFVANNKVYFKSDAILQIARRLNGMWPLFYVFMIIPKFIRNSFYNTFAKHRYIWFGCSKSCMIPKFEK